MDILNNEKYVGVLHLNSMFPSVMIAATGSTVWMENIV